MLWISSYVKLGILPSDAAAKTFYKNTMTVAIVIGLFLLPLGGKIADMSPAYLFIPLTFLVKSLIAIQFQFVDSPLTIYAKSLCISLSLAAGLQTLGIESLFQRNLPKKIRGVMLSYLRFNIILGQAVFGLIAGFIFDKLGPAAPFSFVAFLDWAFIAMVIVFIYRGMLTT